MRRLHYFNNFYTLGISIFLLTSALATPIYGKLADTVGRKLVFLVGLFVFILGSTLSGMLFIISSANAFADIAITGIFLASDLFNDRIFLVASRPFKRGIIMSIFSSLSSTTSARRPVPSYYTSARPVKLYRIIRKIMQYPFHKNRVSGYHATLLREIAF